jgi:3-phenylpropionate/trans-cinnamate dioxygenase ferredoxin reductase component
VTPTRQNAHVIVGAGLAGAKAAEALREEGFDGRVVLIGDEPEAPYERPPLSKDYLRGESPREKARVHADGFYEEHGIELRTETTVASVDVRSRKVELAGGERLGYERLLIATGARPGACRSPARGSTASTTSAISPMPTGLPHGFAPEHARS